MGTKSVGDVNAQQDTQVSNVRRMITLCTSNQIESARENRTDRDRPFAIIVFSTVFLLFTAGGAVMLLMTIGDTKLPSTLNLAIGNNMKRD